MALRDDKDAMPVKPRVFVSSVVEGFSEFREAARQAIVAAGGDPVLVNEDFPSLAASSRNACLDAVDSSDYFMSIVGERSGWTTPGGKLAIEEEYERALARRLPVLVFLQNVGRDAEATRFARQLSDYVDGVFRRTFTTPEQLRLEVERALRPLLSDAHTARTMQRPKRDHFLKPYKVPNTTMLRFVLIPERGEEVIDPMRLGAESFRLRLYELAHSAEVRLLSYEQPKTSEMAGDDLVIVQMESNDRHVEGEHVRLQVTETGELVIDANVTGRVKRGGRFSGVDSMIVAVEDIESVLRLCFGFVAAFYDEIDPFKRHQRFAYNVALSGLDHRVIERNPQDRSSFTMSMRQREIVVAFEQLREVSRMGLRDPATEIQRVVTLLARRAGD